MYNYKKTNVLFVIHQLGVGGSERVVLNLTEKIDPAKFEVFVAAFGGGTLEDDFRKSCKGVFLIDKKPGFDYSAMIQLSKIIKNNNIDVINAHHYMPLFYSFPASKIIKRRQLVFTEHSVPEVDSIKNSIHGKIFNIICYQIDTIVSVSNEIANRFQNHYPRHQKKVATILNGIDIAKFNSKVKKSEIREQWGLTSDHFVIGIVANFRHVKNHACLVRAVSRIKDDYSNVCLFFVGVGVSNPLENSENEIRDLVAEKGLRQHVVFAGYQDDISAILPVFDVFCLPSFSEGLPVSVLEAMAARVPVIGSKARGITEVIKHRHTGLLFDIDNDEELAGLLIEVIQNREILKTMSDNGYKYVVENHDKATWIKQWSNIFSK